MKRHADHISTDYRIAPVVLETIVRGSMEGGDRMQVHSTAALIRTKPIEVTVEEDNCRVTIHAHARFGEDLLRLGTEVQERVISQLGHITGLLVQSVDVVFVGVYPTETED